MGSLVTTLFNVMLGWVRTFASWIQRLLNGEVSESARWFGEHWTGIFIALCVIGALIDLAVYLARWQPFRVWRRTFNRLKERRDGRTAADSGDTGTGPADSFAFGRNVPAPESYAQIPVPPVNAVPAVQDQQPADERPRRRRTRVYEDHHIDEGSGI